jgi:hypothetical protein
MKPREFWIEKGSFMWACYESPDQLKRWHTDSKNPYHVIEYSAYERLERALEIAKDKESQFKSTIEETMRVRDEKIAALERALRFAAGYISATEGFRDKHPMDVLEWIELEANKDLTAATLQGDEKLTHEPWTST